MVSSEPAHWEDKVAETIFKSIHNNTSFLIPDRSSEERSTSSDGFVEHKAYYALGGIRDYQATFSKTLARSVPDKLDRLMCMVRSLTVHQEAHAQGTAVYLVCIGFS